MSKKNKKQKKSKSKRRENRASADAPHLHFAVFKLGPDKRWWKGEALNPYPLWRP